MNGRDPMQQGTHSKSLKLQGSTVMTVINVMKPMNCPIDTSIPELPK